MPAKDSPRKAVSPRSFARTQETRNQFDAPSRAPALGVRAHQSARPPQRSPEILTPQPAVPFVAGAYYTATRYARAGSRVQKIRPVLKNSCGRPQPGAKLRFLNAHCEIAARPAAARCGARGCPSAENDPLRSAVRSGQHSLIDFKLDWHIGIGAGGRIRPRTPVESHCRELIANPPQVPKLDHMCATSDRQSAAVGTQEIRCRERRTAQQRDADHQRPQAELKPVALAFRRVGFGRLGLHGRIILNGGKPEQGIVAAVVNVGSIAGEPVGSLGMNGLAPDWPGTCPLFRVAESPMFRQTKKKQPSRSAENWQQQFRSCDERVLRDLVGPDLERLEPIHAKGRGEGDLGSIAAARHQYAPNPRCIVTRVESVPLSA